MEEMDNKCAAVMDYLVASLRADVAADRCEAASERRLDAKARMLGGTDLSAMTEVFGEPICRDRDGRFLYEVWRREDDGVEEDRKERECPGTRRLTTELDEMMLDLDTAKPRDKNVFMIAGGGSGTGHITVLLSADGIGFRGSEQDHNGRDVNVYYSDKRFVIEDILRLARENSTKSKRIVSVDQVDDVVFTVSGYDHAVVIRAVIVAHSKDIGYQCSSILAEVAIESEVLLMLSRLFQQQLARSPRTVAINWKATHLRDGAIETVQDEAPLNIQW